MNSCYLPCCRSMRKNKWYLFATRPTTVLRLRLQILVWYSFNWDLNSTGFHERLLMSFKYKNWLFFCLPWIALSDFTNFYSVLCVCRGRHTCLKTRLLWGLGKIMTKFSFLYFSMCLYIGHIESRHCGFSPELLSSLGDNLAQCKLFKRVYL